YSSATRGVDRVDPWQETPMRGAWSGLGLVLLLTGCWTTHNPLKPPPPPAEYVLPPSDDARFSGPPICPDKAPSDGQRNDNGPGDAPPGSRRGPAGGRMGAGGPGGPGAY